MKNLLSLLVIGVLLSIFPLACTTPTPSSTGTTNNNSQPTVTPTPTGPTATLTNTGTKTATPTITFTPTVTVTSTFTSTPTSTSVANIGAFLDTPGYRYTLSGANTALSASIVVSVGSSVTWDSTNAGIHPLYIDDGAGNCVVSGQSSFPYTRTFSAVGDYTFHCGNHGVCNNGLSSTVCTLPCSLMTGVIHVQ